MSKSTFFDGVWTAVTDFFPRWFRHLFLGERLFPIVHLISGNSNPKRSGKKIFLPISLVNENGPRVARLFRKSVDVEIPAELVHRRDFRLPNTRLSQFKKLVALDTEKNTPFEIESVAYSYHAHTPNGGSVAVRQWIVKSDDISDLHRNLVSRGVHPQRYVSSENTSAPIWVAPEAKSRFNKILPVINGVSVATIAGASIYVATASIAYLDRQIQDVRTEIQVASQEAVELRMALDAANISVATQARIDATLHSKNTVLKALSDLTNELPDEAWVTEFRFSEKLNIARGSIDGLAARLLVDLQASSVLQNPDFQGPVTKTAEGRERFDLKFEPPTEGEQ